MGAFLVPFAVSTGLNLITSLFGSKSKTVRAEEPNLSMPKSDLGLPIPYIYGRVRLSGNIFFPNKKDILYRVETTTTTSGGKGGGGRTRTERKDVYGTFAVAYCECKTDLVELVINGLGYSPSSELFTNYCTFFDGTQTAPWSVMSNRDDSPYNQIAYKGISYVAFEDLPLAQFGNTPPQQMDVVIENFDFPRNPSLGGVVKDICVRAGFTLGELDTTEIDDDLLEQGIIIPQGGESFRDALSELMQYYLFTAIETSDGKIAFKYFDRTGRSGSSPVTLDPALFFPVNEGSFEKKAFVKKVLATDDQALPEKITLSFYNENRRYNRDEISEYLEDYSDATTLSISVNIATYPYLVRDRLRKLIRYLSTQKRGSYTFELPMTVLTSIDLLSIIALPNGENCQIYQIATGNDFTLKITAQFYSGTNDFTYTPPHDDDLGNLPVFAIPAIPNVYILDIVNIADYPPSTLYALATTACSLSVSADNNQSAALNIDHLRPSTIGDVITAGLPNVSGLDLVNTIDISLVSGAVETITQTQFDTEGNDNLALLGKLAGNGYYSGKLIKFKTVTVLSPTTFRLSYLYQGMLGTDYFSTSSLPLKFFLLRAPSTAYYSTIQGSASFVSQQLKITPIVSSMQNIGATPVTTVTPIGNAYRPPSPTNLVDLKDSQDNIKLVWDYDPVLSAYDNTQVDISYDIEIYNGVTLVRTLTTTNKEIVYTKTLRISDGLGLSFPVKIYGVSSVGGRGIPLSDTISPTLVAGAIFTTGNTLSGIRIITGNNNALASDDGGVVVLQTGSAGTFNLTFSATLPYGFSCYVVNDRNNNASTILNSVVPSTYSRLLNYELVTGSASIVVHISEGTYFTVARNLWLYTYIPVSVTGTILYAMRYWSTAVTATSVLLTPDPNRGDVIGIGADNGVNYATNNLTINGNGFNIEGSATYVFNQNGERGILYFTGTEWRWLDRTKSQGDMLRSVYDTNLDGIVDNSALLNGNTSAFHLARANHTGTQLASTVSDFSEAVDDRVDALLLDTTSILTTYNDAAHTLSLTVIPEFVQDTVGAFTVAGNGMAVTYDDTANTLTIASTGTISNTVTSGTPYTLLSTDRYKWIRADGTMTVTVGTQSSGFECIIQNIGTGTITISGVTNAIGTKLVTRWTACHVFFDGSTWTAVGALTT